MSRRVGGSRRLDGRIRLRPMLGGTLRSPLPLEPSPQLSYVPNSDDFRRIALGMQGASESAHMGHPDFRVNGRIFATLHADHQWGMVKLTPDQQLEFVRKHPRTFKPESGAWGRQGCTAVRLDSVDEDTLGVALTLAKQNIVTPKVVERSKPERTTKKIRRRPKS